MNSDVWLVVPLFNEERVIANVVRKALKTFPKVVCVDDGSTDGSAQAAEWAGAVVLRHPINLGQGAALQTGFDYALGDKEMKYVVTFDADGQHRVEDVEVMVARMREGDLDLVLGSRFLDQVQEFSLPKRLLLKAATVFTNLMTGTRLTDAHNGLRVFAREVIEIIEIRQNRMAHASELVSIIGSARLDGHPLRFAEIPVRVLYTDYSKAKGQSMWNSVNILTELWWR